MAVLLLEYRGFGGDPGSPDEEGLVADALAAWRHLAERHPQLPLVLYGESLDAAVVVGAAAVNPSLPDALVLRSPFPSLGDVGAHVYPLLHNDPELVHGPELLAAVEAFLRDDVGVLGPGGG